MSTRRVSCDGGWLRGFWVVRPPAGEIPAAAVKPATGSPSCTTVCRRWRSETDLHVRIVLGVDRVDEPDLVRHRGHDERVRPRALAEEPYPTQQRAVGDASRRGD